MDKILRIVIISLVSVILHSCSSTNYMTLSVTEPAPVYVPSNIKTIGIINRSLPSKENANLDQIDKILSVEGKDLDKDGANACVAGLLDELTANTRFMNVKVLDTVNLKSPGLGIFPAQLPWKTVERICSQNKVDALFSLSYYDTDAKVSYNAVPVQLDGPLGIKVPALEHHVEMNTLIKAGWNIYDPVNKVVLDEFGDDENVVLTGRGINPVAAAEAILGRKEAVMQASNGIGHIYAQRIIPYSVRVGRQYFVRGTDNFKIAKRMAQTGDWDGAAELWNKETTNQKSKVAGRAYYNMAISNEINGDLDAAIKCASKSYVNYRNKLALRYLNELNYRKQRNIELQQQSK
jgi:hypothetical protein